MNQYALITQETSIVYGVIELDEPENYDPAPYLLVEVGANVVVGPTFSWDGTNFFPPPVPTPDPDWWIFLRSGALSDAYHSIAEATSAQLALAKFKAILAITLAQFETVALDDYSLLQGLWEEVIDGLTTPPTIQQIDELNALAGAAYMTFTFDEDGKVALNQD